jgi:hypothetical protein
MKPRTLAVMLLATVLALGVAACSKGDHGKPTPQPTATIVTPPTTTRPPTSRPPTTPPGTPSGSSSSGG